MHTPSIPPDIQDAQGIPESQAGAFALLFLAEDRLITKGCSGYRATLFFSTRGRAERFLRLEARPEACEWIAVIPVSREFVQVTKRLELMAFILGHASGVRGREAFHG